MSAWTIAILSGSHDRSGFDGGVEVGAALAWVDAKDEKAAAFYRHHQFQDLDGKRLFLPLSVVAKLT